MNVKSSSGVVGYRSDRISGVFGLWSAIAKRSVGIAFLVLWIVECDRFY
ncbi:MAG: hypothetical protein V6D39_15525 [Dolichospermum lemmermannii FEM_B0920]